MVARKQRVDFMSVFAGIHTVALQPRQTHTCVHVVAQAYQYATLSFFAGMFITWLLDLLCHSLIHLQNWFENWNEDRKSKAASNEGSITDTEAQELVSFMPVNACLLCGEVHRRHRGPRAVVLNVNVLGEEDAEGRKFMVHADS